MNAPSSIPGILNEYCWKHDHPGGWDCSACLGSTSPQLYLYVGPPETPYEQPCIHCHEAEAVQPTLYCQPCLDALGQEWLKNYEIGLLHSTLPDFFEAVAMIARRESEVGKVNHADVRVGMDAIWLHKLTDGTIQRKPCKIIGVSSQRVRILVKRWGNEQSKVSVKAQYLEAKERKECEAAG